RARVVAPVSSSSVDPNKPTQMQENGACGSMRRGMRRTLAPAALARDRGVTVAGSCASAPPAGRRGYGRWAGLGAPSPPTTSRAAAVDGKNSRRQGAEVGDPAHAGAHEVRV